MIFDTNLNKITQRKHKRFPYTTRNAQSTNLIAALVIVGVLIGSVLVFATSASLGQIIPKTVTLPAEVVTTTVTKTATSAVTQPAAPNEVAQLPQTVTTPVAPPSGWQTAAAQSLGVSLVAEYDSSGPAAWNATEHPVVYITTNGPGYAGFLSGLTAPGIAIIDANTYQVVLTKQFSIANQTNYNEPHGLGVSMDGRYIYLPTGNPKATSTQTKGEIFVIDAQTLKIHQILTAPAGSGFHHVTSFRLYNGTDVVFALPFTTTGIQATGCAAVTCSGGSYFLMNPAEDNKVIGGFSANSLPMKPYLAFPSPDGEHLFVGARLPQSTAETINNVAGEVFVIDMKTWTLVNTYVGAVGSTPNMFATTDNGNYTYYTDNEMNMVSEINNNLQKIVATGPSPADGPYGITFNYNETLLYVVGKGESHGNTGIDVGQMKAGTLAAVQDFFTGGIRGDHALSNPVHTDEIWISMNSNFRDVAWNTNTNTIDATMLHSGSSHNGAFATYKVLANGQWQGSLLSDQNGLHGAALIAQDKALGVTQVYYGGQTYKTEDQRVLPGESP